MFQTHCCLFFSSWDGVNKKMDCRLIEHSNLGNFSVFLSSVFIYISKLSLFCSSLNKFSIPLVFPGYFSISSLSLFSFLKIWEVNMSHFICLRPSAFPLTSLFKVVFRYSLHIVHWVHFCLKMRLKSISTILANKDLSIFIYLGSHIFRIISNDEKKKKTHQPSSWVFSKMD